MGPDIAAYGDTVYVVVKQTPEADTASHIFIIRSFDGGQNFMAPVRIDYIADSVSRFPTVTTDATGNPIVAYMKFNNTFGASRWVVTKSADYGNAFSVDVKASGWGSSTDVCDCCPGAILSDGNNCAMLYRNNNSNIRDTWMGVSNNNAMSFTNGFNVDNNNWQLFSCPSSGPDGVLIGDTVYSVFMNGGSGNYRTYLSKSSISGVSANSVSNLTGAITGLSQQNYPRIASDGNVVAIVWRQTVNGSSQLPILFTNNINNGFPAVYDTVDLADNTNADVAVSNGNIFVVWQDDNSGTIKYRTGSFTPVTTAIHQFQNNTFNIVAYPNPSNDNWNITANSPNKIINAALYNTLEQVIDIPFATQNAESFTLRINNKNLSQGMYLLRIATATNTQTIRLVKE